MKSTLLLIALAATLTACGSKETAPSIKAVQPALTQIVGAIAAESGQLYSGEVRARHEVALGFRTGGKIVERLAEAGSNVKAGQVLARLDPADAGLQAGAAQAQYQLAESEVTRYRELRGKGFVSQSALDAKEAALQAAKAQAGLARNQSDYTTLRAAHDGVIVAILAEAGQVVSAGQPVLRLAQAGETEVAIEIPESQYAMRHVGDAAQIVLLTEEGVILTGRLRELSSSADPVSRTYSARVAFSAPQAALGMTARVRFNVNVSTELLIPVSAIYQQGRQTAVWIVAADGSVSLRQVQIKAYRDDGAVIAGGLARGERIVSAGVHRLSAGEKIRMIESAQ
ncbi:MAG: efflux RND transporter periplasmic adaptor subunit [Proteobacteria bacterium]|nr:efflux RND transporter periplasmic adaptor subunit [Pseudomonadota bacterium]